jgi:hypothetical protein
MRPLGLDAGEGGRLSIPAEQVHTDIKEGFEASRARLRDGSMGVWARFLGGVVPVGLSADAGVSVRGGAADTFAARRVETASFYPSPALLARCVAAPPVRDYLEAHNYRRPVFLVTGLKVARGLTVRVERAWRAETAAEVGVQTPDGLAGETGPRFRVGATAEDSFSFTDSSDVVVGIQCVRLFYKTKWHGRGGRSIRDGLYTEGAVFLDGEEDQQTSSAENNYIVEECTERDFPQYCRVTQQDATFGEEAWFVPSCNEEINGEKLVSLAS